MRILLITQYFWPESFIINELAEILAEQGHTIKVLTGKPNYPDGEIYEGYTKDGLMDECFRSNISVHRIPLRPRGKSGAKNLLLNYLSFVVNGIRYFPAAVKGESYDVVFVFEPSPITSVIPAIYLKWKLKAHLAVWVQDLWPESLKATGFIKNRFVLWLTGAMVRRIYAGSDTLLAQSQAFKKPLMRYTQDQKIVYYPNSYKEQLPQNTSDLGTELLHELQTNFCVVFAGNLGTAQALHTVLDAAEALRSQTTVRFLLVGSGSQSEWLLQQKNMRQLDNVLLAGRYPAAVMPQLFKQAGALLVSLNKDEIFSYTIPSKIQAYLAAGRPVIAALNGEGARIITEAQAGLTCAAEDSKGLAACVKQLVSLSSEQREAMGTAGRAYFLEHFNMPTQAKRLIDILQQRMKVSN